MKKKLIVIIAGLIVLAGIVYLAWPKVNAAEEIRKRYDVVTVGKMDLNETIDVTGNIYPLQKKEIYSDFSGTVASVKVEAGDAVRQGDILLTIDSAALKEQWDEAMTGLKQAELNLDKAKVQLGTELALNKVTADNALQLENYTHQVGLYREQVKQAEQRLNTLKQKNDGHFQEGSLTIRAPFSGQVAWIAVKEGDKVLPERLLATVIKPDALGVEAEIDQNDIGMVRVGQTAIVIGKDPRRTENAATVTEISTQGQATSEVINFPIRLKVNGQPQGLKPGMSVDLTVTAAEYQDVLAVPASGVIDQNGRAHVNLLRSGQITTVPVTLGYQQGKYWEVKSGLKAGDQVAILKPVLLSKATDVGKRPPMGAFRR